MTTPAPTDQRRERITDRSQLLRAYESLCNVQFPTNTEVRIREAFAVRAAQEFGLSVEEIGLPKALPFTR